MEEIRQKNVYSYRTHARLDPAVYMSVKKKNLKVRPRENVTIGLV